LNCAISERRSAGFSRPCRQPTRKPFSSTWLSRAASTSAAFACRVSDSSITGQTTYACRPSSSRRRRRVYASELRSCGIQRVTIGLRFAGGFAISLTERSP
jgi:hypothetical protein